MEAARKLLSETKQQKKKKKKQKSNEELNEDEPASIDLLVDIIIGLLEGSTSFTRTIANESFAMLTPLMTDSTISLVLAVSKVFYICVKPIDILNSNSSGVTLRRKKKEGKRRGRGSLILSQQTLIPRTRKMAKVVMKTVRMARLTRRRRRTCERR